MEIETTPQRKILKPGVSMEVANAFRAGEVAIIDVRTIQEYAFEHIRGALLLPMHFFEPERLPSFRTESGSCSIAAPASAREKVARAALEAQVLRRSGPYGRRVRRLEGGSLYGRKPRAARSGCRARTAKRWCRPKRGNETEAVRRQPVGRRSKVERSDYSVPFTCIAYRLLPPKARERKALQVLGHALTRSEAEREALVSPKRFAVRAGADGAFGPCQVCIDPPSSAFGSWNQKGPGCDASGASSG